jgi:hypothetical protein
MADPRNDRLQRRDCAGLRQKKLSRLVGPQGKRFRDNRPNQPSRARANYARYSHSIVPGGFDVTS